VQRTTPSRSDRERSRERRGVALARVALGGLVLAAAVAAAAGVAVAADPDPASVAIEIQSAKWESGYGVRFFQVVGTAANRGERPVGAVQVRTELLDAAGKVVATGDCWNGRAEALNDLDAARAKIASPGIEPIAPGKSDRWRCTFVEEDVPAFESHRARVATVLAAP
jgi:hypothetical protein